MKVFQVLLLPFALIYGLVMMIRNKLFDLNILRTTSFNIPTVSVGNLAAGGTGKTPHIEYLVKLLGADDGIAILSRGYGRKTKGFLMATPQMSAITIGDEPLQFITRFTGIKVAVDENRVHGVSMLMDKYAGLKTILLDDAYQHRWIKPGLAILLTDYHHLFTHDLPLPAGRLREFRYGTGRADIIIVTKSPRILSPITRRRIEQEIDVKPHQKLFFTYISYQTPVPVKPLHGELLLEKPTYILLFTGIADDTPLRKELKRRCTELAVIKFADHHKYNARDLEKIRRVFIDLPTKKKIIMTTEKDMMRLKDSATGNLLNDLPLFYIPMEVEFHKQDKEEFDKLVTRYVAENKRIG